ncbi:MAG: bifunctional oligoribonuclease/PAP phosphatase NrnA [Elusimicrobiota bacterium]|jgi:phosphoesterase RecJ-like protein|nr:bifunctional oligoribonuclease/PAP phosphatase NrnA [Elusimicrobiota bacterium]
MKKQNNKKDNKTFKQIAAAFKKGKKFFVAGHQNPDGDSLGSTLAVASLLKRMGKQVYAFSNDRPGDDLLFLPYLNTVHFSKLPAKIDFDTLVLLECSDKNRGGDLGSIFSAVKTVINIDHHITGEPYGTINYINAEASSTAEIITQIFEYLKIKPTKEEATCLYTGVVTDTARFLHSNTTAESLRAASVLVENGAEVSKINTIIYNTRPYRALKLLGRALEKLKLLYNDKIAEITLEKKDFKALKVQPEHTQGIVSQPIMIPSVEVSVLFRQEDARIAVNLRSKGKVDVSAIAAKFGGGGHARAAGFKLKDAKLPVVKKQLLAAVKAAVSALK